MCVLDLQNISRNSLKISTVNMPLHFTQKILLMFWLLTFVMFGKSSSWTNFEVESYSSNSKIWIETLACTRASLDSWRWHLYFMCFLWCGMVCVCVCVCVRTRATVCANVCVEKSFIKVVCKIIKSSERDFLFPNTKVFILLN